MWPWAKYPITKSGHRKEIGGGVWTHAGFSKIQHKYNENKIFRTFHKILSRENKTFRTFYKILSLACRGGPPCRRGTNCRMFCKLMFLCTFGCIGLSNNLIFQCFLTILWVTSTIGMVLVTCPLLYVSHVSLRVSAAFAV